MMVTRLASLLALILLNSSGMIAGRTSLRAKFSHLGIPAVFPGDANYTALAASFNRRVTYKPVAVAFPSDTRQVACIVKLAIAEKVPVCPRSGGHSYAAYGSGSHGAIVIDLQRLKTITVDTLTGHARIGTGNRLGDVVVGLNKHKRGLPHGTCPGVGIGGHVAFGGFGFISRKWGLTLDNVIGHEVVLANGTIVKTSMTSHPDLFWALRGAGASYGVMTAVHFQTHLAPNQTDNYSYTWQLNEVDLARALLNYQAFCHSGPPALLGAEGAIRKGNKPGTLTFSFQGNWYGQSSELNAILSPFLQTMPKPESESVVTTDWFTSLKRISDNQPFSSEGVDFTTKHSTFYAKSLTTPQTALMSNSSLYELSRYLAREGFRTDTSWFIQIRLFGGKNSAITSVPVQATAFAQRSILFTIQFYAATQNTKPPYPASGLTFLDRMVSSIVNNNPVGWKYGGYANYVDDRLSPSQWKSQYYGSNYKRLMHIKSLYDPQNMFSFPQSITKGK